MSATRGLAVVLVYSCLATYWERSRAYMFSSEFDSAFSPSPISTHVASWPTVSNKSSRRDEENDEDILNGVMMSMQEHSRLVLARQHSRRKRRNEEVVCYKDLGCFRDNGAFNYLDVLPSPPEEVGTKFMFYSRQNADIPVIHVFTDGHPLQLNRFNGSAEVKFIIHGFGSSCGRLWVHDMRTALLNTLDCNVVCVDWSRGATTPNYMRAAANTQLVGRQVAVILKQLVTRYGVTMDRLHLIGFSLGAHVLGFAGSELNGTVNRITGLDPAGPLFEGYPPEVRLDPSDARFVDVIHSNGDSLLRGGLGTYEQLGHVDYYPNGGRMQKGCTNLFLGAFSDLFWSGAGSSRSLCNHRRSYRFFIESISPRCHFPAMHCENYEALLRGECFPCNTRHQCGRMGYYADQSPARGKLYLITRESDPFCANQNKVMVNGNTEDQTYGRVEISLIAAPNINETFPLTSSDGDEISNSMTRMLVAHPAITGVQQVQLLYVAYNGWLYSGTPVWNIDRLAITDSSGKSVSYCKRATVLRSGQPKIINLAPGHCRVSYLRPTPNFWNQPGPGFDPQGASLEEIKSKIKHPDPGSSFAGGNALGVNLTPHSPSDITGLSVSSEQNLHVHGDNIGLVDETAAVSVGVDDSYSLARLTSPTPATWAQINSDPTLAMPDIDTISNMTGFPAGTVLHEHDGTETSKPVRGPDFVDAILEHSYPPPSSSGGPPNVVMGNFRLQHGGRVRPELSGQRVSAMLPHWSPRLPNVAAPLDSDALVYRLAVHQATENVDGGGGGGGGFHDSAANADSMWGWYNSTARHNSSSDRLLNTLTLDDRRYLSQVASSLVTRTGKALPQHATSDDVDEADEKLLDSGAQAAPINTASQPEPTQPTFYMQYLPAALFGRPAVDHVPGPSVVPPLYRRQLPPPAPHQAASPGSSSSTRHHRQFHHPPPSPPQAVRPRPMLKLSFLRHMLPMWQQPPPRKYIPLHDTP